MSKPCSHGSTSCTHGVPYINSCEACNRINAAQYSGYELAKEAEKARHQLSLMLWEKDEGRSWSDIVAAVERQQSRVRVLLSVVAEKHQEGEPVKGWQCPVCSVVWAPSVRRCEGCGPKETKS